jgi:hypothetical protein
MEAGYATAMVIGKFAKPTAYHKDGIKIVPCPEERGRVETCTACQLCWKDDILRRAHITIGFEAHSVQASKIRDYLLRIEAAQPRTAGAAL